MASAYHAPHRTSVASSGVGSHATQSRTTIGAEGLNCRARPAPWRKLKILASAYSRVPQRETTIGAEGLNFRVRDGNGCTPFARNTRILSSIVPRGGVRDGNGCTPFAIDTKIVGSLKGTSVDDHVLLAFRLHVNSMLLRSSMLAY